MRVTIHRGCRQIGGTCIELTSGDTRLVLDAGLPLVNADRTPFDSRAARQKSVEQLRADGTLPPVPGLFVTDPNSLPPSAILLTHAHLDHSGLLPYTRPEVPVYASVGTSKMMLAAAVFARLPNLDRTRHRSVSSRVPVSIGPFAVTPLAVDHSVFGSLAFLIEAEGRRVLYTGDLRAHGRKPGMLRRLLRATAERPVDLLFTEGTHLGRGNDGGPTERDVEEELVRLTRGTAGLVLACYSPLDLDRLVSVYRTAVRTGRVFVADAYAAFILHLVHRTVRVPRPTRENGIQVYFPRPFLDRGETRLHRLFAPDRIDWPEIQATPARYLMTFRPSIAELDLCGQLPGRCRAIHSHWEGYLASEEWVRFQALVKASDGDFHHVHASGHIRTPELIDFVHRVDARRVVPIHTFEPAELAAGCSNVVPATDGVPFDLP